MHTPCEERLGTREKGLVHVLRTWRALRPVAVAGGVALADDRGPQINHVLGVCDQSVGRLEGCRNVVVDDRWVVDEVRAIGITASHAEKRGQIADEDLRRAGSDSRPASWTLVARANKGR